MSDELLLELIAEVRLIRAALESRAAGPDHAGLLRAIHAACGTRAFTAGDLALHVALPASHALRGAILGVCRGLGARSIGRVLKRLEGRDADGLRLRRVCQDRDGAVFAIESVALTVAPSSTRAASSSFRSRT